VTCSSRGYHYLYLFYSHANVKFAKQSRSSHCFLFVSCHLMLTFLHICPPRPLSPMQKSRYPKCCQNVYICIIYTPNLGLGIALFDRDREHGRFTGSTEGARGSTKGARESSGGVRGSTKGAQGRSTGAQYKGA